MPEQSDQAFWDERYLTHPTAIWSGRPNEYLLREAVDLQPGRALDVACGEGADAIWLAERGWQVTAVDLSPVALQRGAALAEQTGPETATRIEWVHADLTTWDPGSARFDLVTSHYIHLPSLARRAMTERLAGALAPGGSLLVVGHHPSDLQTSIPRPPEPDLFFTGDDIAADLGAYEWEIVTNAAPGRTATDPEGNAVTIHDTVFRAQRRT